MILKTNIKNEKYTVTVIKDDEPKEVTRTRKIEVKHYELFEEIELDDKKALQTIDCLSSEIARLNKHTDAFIENSKESNRIKQALLQNMSKQQAKKYYKACAGLVRAKVNANIACLQKSQTLNLDFLES